MAVKLLRVWELVVRVFPAPSMIKVELPGVTAPLEKSTLPETVHMPEPIEMDGTPVELLIKLKLLAILTVGLLTEQSSISAPASVAWNNILPLRIRSPNIVNI